MNKVIYPYLLTFGGIYTIKLCIYLIKMLFKARKKGINNYAKIFNFFGSKKCHQEG